MSMTVPMHLKVVPGTAGWEFCDCGHSGWYCDLEDLESCDCGPDERCRFCTF